MGAIVYKRVKWVVLFITSISIILMYLLSINTGISFMLGAGISLIPTFLFGRIFFRTTGTSTARKILNTFYIGEAIKIVTTVVLFILVFQWQELEPLFLFLGFITAQLGCLLAFL